MADIKLIKRWGSYDKGYVIKNASVPTIKELVHRLRVGELVKSKGDKEVEKILEQEMKAFETEEQLKEEFEFEKPLEEIKEEKEVEEEKKTPPQRRSRKRSRKKKKQT